MECIISSIMNSYCWIWHGQYLVFHYSCLCQCLQFLPTVRLYGHLLSFQPFKTTSMISKTSSRTLLPLFCHSYVIRDKCIIMYYYNYRLQQRQGTIYCNSIVATSPPHTYCNTFQSPPSILLQYIAIYCNSIVLLSISRVRFRNSTFFSCYIRHNCSQIGSFSTIKTSMDSLDVYQLKYELRISC